MQKYTVVCRVCLAALAAWVVPSSLHAKPTIETQTYQLQPNTAGQVIKIYAHGGDSVQGVDFDIQTGNGGPYSYGNVAGAAPVITAVNAQPGLVAGETLTSIFTTSNSNPQGPPAGPPQYGGADTDPANPSVPDRTVSQLWEISFTSKVDVNVGTGDTVAQHQLLATITIDTHGFNIGQTFPLIVIGTNGGDTAFSGLGGGIATNGPNPGSASTLQIVPEPASFALMLLGAPMLLLRRRAASATL